MICPKCQDKGHYNEVMGKGYYYCRTCKDEISLEEPKATATEVLSVGTGFWGSGLTNALLPPIATKPHKWVFQGSSSVCANCKLDAATYNALMPLGMNVSDCDPSVIYKLGAIQSLGSGAGGNPPTAVTPTGTKYYVPIGGIPPTTNHAKDLADKVQKQLEDLWKGIP